MPRVPLKKRFMAIACVTGLMAAGLVSYGSRRRWAMSRLATGSKFLYPVAKPFNRGETLMASFTVRDVAFALLLVGMSVHGAKASLNSYGSHPRGDTGERVEELRTSALRSAYLIRAGIVRYDARDMSPQGVQRQLKRHFDVVIALLIAGTPEHVELALDRLEVSLQKSWTAAERDAWRRQLLDSRRLQIARLVAYRNHGQFPLNEGHASGAIPIFVDAHDTACAVGHLMRQSGLGREVGGIREASNLIYVPDAEDGPLVAWTLTSGITLEEAALIQPAYGPVLLPKPGHAVEVLGGDASFVFEHLRYSNVKIIAGDDLGTPDVNIPLDHRACSWFGCGPTFPVIWEYDLSEVTQFVPEPIPPIRRVQHIGLDQDPPLLSSFPRMVVQFDVEVTAPNLRIASLPNGGSLLSNSYFDGPQFRLFANASQDRLWIDQVHNPMPECDGWFCPIGLVGLTNSTSDAFQPTDHMTVVTEMYFPPDQEFRGQFINFSLVAVPEPAAAALAIVAIGLYAMPRSRMRPSPAL
jgi:hypothetical protein